MIAAAIALLAQPARRADPWERFQRVGAYELVVRFYENTGASYTHRYATLAACDRARQAIIDASQERQRRNPHTNLPEPFTACVPQ